ncbi:MULTISPECIES: FAD-binding oxidoreductase [unclassified Streptomyces]|uniref:FAD-binding oxidoreductase n=1 Tax=unclassified Streptomyces TaxID=2593676 RepID=UPI00278C328A|nr:MULTISPECIES: FAD-binding oxidoreductase [unclassified Streptomyces]
MTDPQPVGERVARALGDSFSGALHLPGNEPYDTERLAWMRVVESRPAAVAVASGAADIQAAVRAARDLDVPFAVQSTGHGAVRPSDGGLLLRTSSLNRVVVDPGARTALVEPGALWSDVIAAAAPHGLAPLSGTSSVGALGFTLGGGIGWLSRRYGLAADSLLSAEIVGADGTLRTADADSHRDLLWALRGGSGNFGAVTRYTIRLYPVRTVYAGAAFFPVERGGEGLAGYLEWAPTVPDEMSTAVLLMRMPPGPPIPEPMRGKQFLCLRVCFDGPASEGERLLKPLLDTWGTPLMNGIAEMPFAQSGTAIAGPPPPPMVAAQEIDLFHELPREAVDVMVAAAGADSPAPPMSTVEIRHWGGAMAAPGPDAGPAAHRDAPYSVITTAMIPGPQAAEGVTGWTKGLASRLRPYATGGTFLNFLIDPARTRSAFTEANWARLTEAKRKWDPDNVFRINHNIPPN